ncbi:hypothetical protein [Azorhizobium sp. AG788]|uniref:hypothetical protein n=1 Tax=Azorhizobium sp. AG788 TaxID=2183897 RepID=UPI00313A3D1A
MTPDLSKLSFVVTDAAGPKVAGRVVKPGDTLLLTEFEARSELLAGVIRPATETEAVAEVPADDKPARRR